MMLILRRDPRFPLPTLGPTFGIWDLSCDGEELPWEDTEVQWQRLTTMVTTGECDAA